MDLDVYERAAVKIHHPHLGAVAQPLSPDEEADARAVWDELNAEGRIGPQPEEPAPGRAPNQ